MPISKAEWEIMRVVWTKGETTSTEILNILSQKTEWTSSTVKTLLKRLVDKGYLNTEKIGKKFVYSALINEENTINNEVDEHFEKFCQRKHLAILEHLIETVPMTCDDITKLQDLLNDKQRKTVVEVVCNCTPGQCHCKENLEVTP